MVLPHDKTITKGERCRNLSSPFAGNPHGARRTPEHEQPVAGGPPQLPHPCLLSNKSMCFLRSLRLSVECRLLCDVAGIFFLPACCIIPAASAPNMMRPLPAPVQAARRPMLGRRPLTCCASASIPTITVVGLGPGPARYMTREAFELVTQMERPVRVRTLKVRRPLLRTRCCRKSGACHGLLIEALLTIHLC